MLENVQRSLDASFVALCNKSLHSDKNYAEAEYDVYNVLAEAYLFFRQARDESTTFLSDKYKEEGLQWHDKRTDETNFRPFVRLVFRLDLPNPTEADRQRWNLTKGSQANRVNDYAAVLKTLDEAWTADADNFRKRSHSALLAVLNKDGIKGMAKAQREKNAASTGPDNEITETPTEVATTKKHLADSALEILSSSTSPLGSAQFPKGHAAQPSDKGLLACVCKFDAKSNSYQIVATSNDPSVLRGIAAARSVHLDNVRSNSVRVLAEVAVTQLFPAQYIPDGDRALLTGKFKDWYHSVYLEQSEKFNKGVSTQRRLVVRGGKDIVLSAQRTGAGVVTLFKPSNESSLLPRASKDEVSLRTQQLRLIEEWVLNGTIAARISKPANKLAKSANGDAHKYHLVVENAAAPVKPNTLYFYDVNRANVNPESAGQVDLDIDRFKAQWSFTTTPQWLVQLRDTVLDNWFQLVGARNKLKREENQLFNVSLSKTTFNLGYEIVEGGQNPSSEVQLATPAMLPASGAVSMMMFAKDLAPVLYNLADITINGDVTIEGDSAVMIIRFSTELGAYTIAVPTISKIEAAASARGKKAVIWQRNPKWFSSYAARGGNNA